MGCLFPHAAQAMRTWGRCLQHQQQVPCYLLDEGSSPAEGDATSAPWSCTPGHTRGHSQLLLLLTQSACKRSYTQSRRSPKPTLLVWAQRPEHLVPKPQGHPTTNSKQPQESPGAQNCTQSCTYLVQMAERASRGAQTHKIDHRGW